MKVVVFIIVCFVILLISMALKESGAGAVMSIGAVAIIILYNVMFKKGKDSKKSEDSNDITLKK